MLDNWKNQNSTPPVILFASPPPLETLRALTVRVDSLAQTSQPALKFQPQVIKCREFIFTEPEVIGSPSLDPKDQCFHLIAQLSLLQSGKLQSRLSRVGLQVTKPYPVTPELYQSCLRYTLTAKISPNWNKVGEWLIQGRDFLTHRGAVNAVKMDLSVNCNELYFTLEATALKLASLKVTDLDVLGDQIDKFLKHHVSEINHDSIASDWCFVLPSMKRGKIISISHEIPEESPFMSYRDLKRFWKNTYGYRLPESDEEMVYYQIHFGPLGGKLFTYPEVCLRAREIQRVARVDPKPILRDFMKEITTKFPTICGAPMKLQSKAKFPLAELFESRQKDPHCQPNLTNKMSARPSGYRSKEEMKRLLASKTDLVASQRENKLATTCFPVSGSVNSQLSTAVSNFSQTRVTPHKPLETPSKTGQPCYLSDEQIASQNNSAPKQTEGMVTQPSVARQLVFPKFKPKKPMTQISDILPVVPQAPKYVLTFCVQKRPNSLHLTEKCPDTTSSQSSAGIVSSQAVKHPVKTIPLFFKKSVAEKKAFVEITAGQKTAVVKKTVTGPVSKAVKEKPAKSVKRNLKKEGEGKKKKLKQNLQLPEQ